MGGVEGEGVGEERQGGAVRLLRLLWNKEKEYIVTIYK